MRSIKVLLILLSFLCTRCKDDGDAGPAESEESVFFAFKGGAFNFRSIEAVHDSKESLIFFYDALTKTGIVYNYSTRTAITKGLFKINQDGYVGLDMAISTADRSYTYRMEVKLTCTI
jgi:hypothetical protein